MIIGVASRRRPRPGSIALSARAGKGFWKSFCAARSNSRPRLVQFFATVCPPGSGSAAEPDFGPQAAFATAKARRRIVRPIPPNPIMSIAQVEGSGTTPAAVENEPSVWVS